MAMENSCVTPATMKIQLDLFLDYASNVALYPKFHEYFATKRPPFLAVWGKNDPPAPRPSVAIIRTPKCTSTTPATLRSKRM